MKRRTFLTSTSALLSLISIRCHAKSSDPSPMLMNVQLIIFDAFVNSRQEELAKVLNVKELSTEAVEVAEAQLRKTGSKIAAVTRYDLPNVDNKYSPLVELYVTVRIDIDYLDSDRSSIVGAVGLFLRRSDYSEFYPRAWTFFKAEVEPPTVTTAAKGAMADQVEFLAGALSQ